MKRSLTQATCCPRPTKQLCTLTQLLWRSRCTAVSPSAWCGQNRAEAFVWRFPLIADIQHPLAPHLSLTSHIRYTWLPVFLLPGGLLRSKVGVDSRSCPAPAVEDTRLRKA